jgi:CRP-like cAMP-binding protein
VKLIIVSAQGKEATVAILGADEFIGEDCVLGSGATRKTSAIAMTACTLMRIEKAEMIRVLHAENSFSDSFIAYLLFQNSRIQSDYVDQLFNTTEKRLARTLLQMVNFGPGAAPQEIVPKISQQMLAEMIGCTRSRVSFFMNRFRKEGFIDYNGKFTIHSTLVKVILRN